MTEPPKNIIAEFTDYPSLHVALRLVREHRNISFETLDEIVGAPRGYFSKVFAPKSARKITMQSLGWALNGLGVKAVLVDDPVMLKQIASRLKKRDETVVRSDARHIIVSRRFLKKIGAIGGKRKMERLTPSQRRKLARHAARMRWRADQD